MLDVAMANSVFPFEVPFWYVGMNNGFYGFFYHRNSCDNNSDYVGDAEASNNSQVFNGTGGNGDDQYNQGCCGSPDSN